MPDPEPILVLSATEMEIEALAGRAACSRDGDGGTGLLSRGSIAGRPVLFAVTGVGKSNAAFSAGYLLSRHPCRALLNIGCAGAFRGSGLSVGDVVVADREVLADEGTLSPQGFLDLEAMGLPDSPPGGPGERAPPGSLERNVVPVLPLFPVPDRDLSSLSAHLGFRVMAGPLSTVSTCSGTDARAAEVAERWRPLAESMEGAALALAAHRLGLPFLEVRGISNFAGDRRKAEWSVGAAAENAAAVAYHLLSGRESWQKPRPGAPR